MSCSRTSRPAAFLSGSREPRRRLLPYLAAVLAAALLGPTTGCRESLPDPTEAQVKIRFLSAESGLAEGAQVLMDGRLIRSSLSEDTIDTLLAAGEHQVIFRKTCVSVEPSDTLRIRVDAGVSQQADFRLAPASNVLVVDSDIAGLAISLNGVATGRVTPSSFVCMEAGRYQVGVPGAAIGRLGFNLVEGDTLQTVDVPAQGRAEAFFAFAYSPQEQPRGVLLEIFTATLCPNCPKADEAADRIELDPAFDDAALACVQVHLTWMGSDPFYNDEIGERVSFYGNDQSAPYVFFNGLEKMEGSSNPALEEAYRTKIQRTYGAAAEAGLYWSDVRLEGHHLSGDLRFVAIDDLTRFSQLRLTAFVAKDSLIAPLNPYDVPQFNGVIRDYSETVVLDTVRSSGAFLDQTIQFDLEEDNEDWPSPALRLVAFVQDAGTREIIQCREVRVSMP